MKTRELDQAMNFVIQIGSSLLSSGAETYRVEETVERIALAAGMHRAEVYATHTGIFVTLEDNSGITSTQLRRIKHRSMSLAKVEQINQISRQLAEGEISVKEAMIWAQKLEQYENLYTKPTYILATALSSGSFVFLFNGWIKEFIFASFAGFLIGLVQRTFKTTGIHRFLSAFVGAAAAAFTGSLAKWFDPSISMDIIVVSSLMTLVPGVAITSAIRDVIYEDYVAGAARSLEAFIQAVSIAAGVLFIYSLAKWVGG